jgi:hypothetical protein
MTMVADSASEMVRPMIGPLGSGAPQRFEDAGPTTATWAARINDTLTLSLN